MDSQINRNFNRDKWIIHIAVVISYFVKASIKLATGFVWGVPLLINDGLHGGLDIAEHGLIAWIGKHARKEKEALYPLGKKPLLDIVGLIIGLGIAGLGLKCLNDGFKASWSLVEHFFHLSDLLPHTLAAFFPSLPLDSENENPLITGIIFVSCALCSYLVSRIETFLARKHHLKEYVDDAAEMHQDATLELSTGLCLLAACLFTAVLHRYKEIPNLFGIINSASQTIVLFFLSGYLLYHAYHAILGNVRNLLHPGLDEEATDLLKLHLKHSLPSGCSIADSDDEKLIAYKTGDVLFVSGVICIPRQQMASSDLILQHAQHLAKQFLKKYAEDFHIRFFPVNMEWTEDDVKKEWKQIIENIWLISGNRDIWDQFTAYKQGNYSTNDSFFEWKNMELDHTQIFQVWLSASCNLFQSGAMSESTLKSSAMITQLLPRLAEHDPRRVLFLCWQILRSIMSGQIYRNDNGNYISELSELRGMVTSKSSGMPTLILAESHFVLGLLEERHPSFNLEKSQEYYRRSLSLYFESGIPLEADRLLNTWGHQKGLLYEIEDSLYLLNQSRKIKEVKGDQAGLAFTYGCLGDTYRRAGLCDAASKAYQNDLDICRVLGLSEVMPSIQCKQAESEICRGILEDNNEKIQKAIAILQKILDTSRPAQVQFFINKGLAKGLLWLAFRSQGAVRNDYLTKAKKIFDTASPFSPYTDALWKRLTARWFFLSGDMGKAHSCQLEAQSQFKNMTTGVFSRMYSLQSICCALEMAFCGPKNEIHEVCDDLSRFSLTMGGLLGPVQDKIDSCVFSLKDSSSDKLGYSLAGQQLVALLEG